MDEKPIHESIVDAIRHTVELQGESDVRQILFFLIQGTKIPANHDAIIDAWTKRYGESEEFNSMMLAKKQAAAT